MKIITSLATIKHLNIRKEGPDDDKVLAVDIKFGDIAGSMDLFARILGTDDTNGVMLSFWDADDNLRYVGMDPISSWCVIEGCTAKIGGLVLTGAKVHKFKARLESEHKISMEFSVSVTNPPSNAVPILAEYVQDQITVDVSKDQEELDLGPSQDSPLQNGSTQPDVDELFQEARRIVVESGRGSISFVQRSLSVGYNRAARLVEALELAGVVSPVDSIGKRTVLEIPAS